MTHGWYLLDESKRALVLTSAGEEAVPYGPLHVRFRPVGDDGSAAELDRFSTLVDEIVTTGAASASLAGHAALTHPAIGEIGAMLADRGVTVTDVETDGTGLTERAARVLLDAVVHYLTLVSDETSPGALDYLVRTRDLRGLHLPKVVRRASAALEVPAASATAPVEFSPLVRVTPDAGGSPDELPILPWYGLFVDERFEVWPCEHLAARLGSARERPLGAVWNGPAMRAYRRALATAALGRTPEPGAPRPCRACAAEPPLADERFLSDLRTRTSRRRAGLPVAPWAHPTRAEGVDAPALRAFRERHPRETFPPNDPTTADRYHAEAEAARVESLTLAVRAARLAAEANRLVREPDRVGEAMAMRVEAARLGEASRRVEVFSERLFAETGHAAGAEAIAASHHPFVAMKDWLARLAAEGAPVDPDVDETYVSWMSLFKTLAEHADLSLVHRALGVGAGYSGPEQYYNDAFHENYCLDLMDYSHLNPKLRFVVADIEEGVDFPDGHFDLVYSHSVFEHLKDVRRAIREIDRLLGIGKYAYITVAPLYYSPRGSHVNVPRQLTRWEHLYPDSEYFLLDAPHMERIDEGFYLNKLTASDFLAAVGSVGWEIRHFSVRIVHPREVPRELRERYPLVDLAIEEFRFVGRKVIPA